MSNVRGNEVSFSSDEAHRQLDNRKLKNEPLRPGPTPTNSSGSTSHQPPKKKRNLPGNPDPTAEVVALSPKTLMAKNRFVCEICNKGFPRDQNLQLHKRGHNLPWKLRQRTGNEVKRRVFICPEPSCVHHDPSRALGDLTGIKKHYSRKHEEKKLKCDKCSKKYAVQSDWKAHHKTCGTREYKCDCGTVFSRRDSFITHRAFCDALTRENSKLRQGILGPMVKDSESQMTVIMPMSTNSFTSVGQTDINDPFKSLQQELIQTPFKPMHMESLLPATSSSGPLFGSSPRSLSSLSSGLPLNANLGPSTYDFHTKERFGQIFGPSNMSATALLQKTAQLGTTVSNTINSPTMAFVSSMASPDMLSGPRPTPNIHIFDKFQSANEKSPLLGGGFLQKNTEDTAAPLFEVRDPGGSALRDMLVYGGMLIGDPNPVAGFFNTMMEVQEGDNMMGITPTSLVGSAVATVDFLGLGGSGPQNPLADQRLDPENMNPTVNARGHF